MCKTLCAHRTGIALTYLLPIARSPFRSERRCTRNVRRDLRNFCLHCSDKIGEPPPTTSALRGPPGWNEYRCCCSFDSGTSDAASLIATFTPWRRPNGCCSVVGVMSASEDSSEKRGAVGIMTVSGACSSCAMFKVWSEQLGAY